MPETICFDKTMFMSFVIFVAILTFVAHNKKEEDVKFKCPKVECPQCNQPNINITSPQQEPLQHQNQQAPPQHQHAHPEQDADPVKQYDYNKITDPLTEPTRRVPRYYLPPDRLKRFIDIRTQGYPDNFQQMGYLVKNPTDEEKNPRPIVLPLFGRQEHYGSNRYEYYTSVTSDGGELVKIPLNLRYNKELYDDDVVNIKEFESSFIVRIYKLDSPTYYPHVF